MRDVTAGPMHQCRGWFLYLFLVGSFFFFFFFFEDEQLLTDHCWFWCSNYWRFGKIIEGTRGMCCCGEMRCVDSYGKRSGLYESFLYVSLLPLLLRTCGLLTIIMNCTALA